MRTLQLGNLKAGEGQRVFIIAEIGINHGGNLKRCMKMIKAAATAGANNKGNGGGGGQHAASGGGLTGSSGGSGVVIIRYKFQ